MPREEPRDEPRDEGRKGRPRRKGDAAGSASGRSGAAGSSRGASERAARRAERILAQGGRVNSEIDGAVMVLVPPGPFFMGRKAGDIFAPEDERPGRTVQVGAYLIDRDPVTNERFSRFVDAGGYVDPHLWPPAGWAWRVRAGVDRPLSFTTPKFDAPDQPAGGVSWFEAFAYARWAGKQLPTEAQWEKAARGGDCRPFPWGEDLPRSDLCNFNSNVGHTTPPGAYPKGESPYGLADMAGNVNNWCRDWYWDRFYAYCAEKGIDADPCLTDELRAEVGIGLQMRSDRGGGFATSFSAFEVLAATGRLSWPPDRRHPWNGFRCVVEL